MVVFDYLAHTLCYIHNGDASNQDYCKYSSVADCTVCTVFVQ